MQDTRIQKYLSQAGICSRRKAEEYILAGQVYVNGQKAELGQKIDPEKDSVTFGQEAVHAQENLVYYKLNKPRGVVTTMAQGDQVAIVDIIDIPTRVFPIGRLDKDTTGLILLTNDGRLANFLMHPKYHHEKEYIVETFGPIGDKELKQLASGVFILGRYTKKAKVQRLSSGTFSITISEGRNRQIRRMVEKVGHTVKRLKRVRVENILLGDLREGVYKELTKKEKDTLFKSLQIQ